MKSSLEPNEEIQLSQPLDHRWEGHATVERLVALT